MGISTITLFIALCITAVVVITYSLSNKEELIKKAEKNMFFHIVAKMTSLKYDGYVMNDDEKKAMREYLSKSCEHVKHPIGSYFELCNTLKNTLSSYGNFHNYKLDFNMSELGIGFLVLAVFVVVITSVVIYG